MKIKINGEEFDIKDSKELIVEIEFDGDLDKASVRSGSVNLSSIKVKNNYLSIIKEDSIKQINIGRGGQVFGDVNCGSINITINGNVGEVDTDNGDVIVNGNADTVDTNNGSVEVSGDAHTVDTSNGKIIIGKDVEGNVTSSNGNINVHGDIKGKVKTSNGNIKKKRKFF